MEERESRAITRLLHEARLPRMKTLVGVRVRSLRRVGRATSHPGRGRLCRQGGAVLLVGEAGTDETHLATGLCVAACRQRRRVRFTTATALINELAEAAHANKLSRALGRWERLDPICIDELGHVPLAETAAGLNRFPTMVLPSEERCPRGRPSSPPTAPAAHPKAHQETRALNQRDFGQMSCLFSNGNK
jgi:DNA replication protein DnaC